MTKHKVSSKILLLCFLFFWITSVNGQYNYINDTGTVNMSLSNKKDLKLLTLLSKEEKNVQIGFSPYKNIAIKGEYFNNKGKGLFSDVKLRSNQFSFSTGVYHFIENSKGKRVKIKYKNTTKKGCLLYLNGGYTKGIIQNEWLKSVSKLNYNKYFSDIGVKLNYYYVSFRDST